MRALLVILLAALPATLAAQPAPRGQILFLQCRACHTLKLGEANKVGPNLGNIFARAPLGASGFKYSAAFTAARPRWTPASLDRWIERPGVVVKGTSMAFAGIAKAEDRAILIAWLQEATR
jgi:cytochrome c